MAKTSFNLTFDGRTVFSVEGDAESEEKAIWAVLAAIEHALENVHKGHKRGHALMEENKDGSYSLHNLGPAQKA